MSIINLEDTINDPFLGGQANINTDVVNGGRNMSSQPHIDGYLYRNILGVNSANLAYTRNAKGDWSYNRTAAAAETYYLRTTMDDLLRTGEVYNLGLFGSSVSGTVPQTFAPTAPPKGISILDIFAVYSVGVVALTTATLRYGKSVYPLYTAAAAAVAQTDIVAATAIATAVTGAGIYLTNRVAVPATIPLSFLNTDMTQYEIELALVMANTGTVQVAGIGVHVAFNYD